MLSCASNRTTRGCDFPTKACRNLENSFISVLLAGTKPGPGESRMSTLRRVRSRFVLSTQYRVLNPNHSPTHPLTTHPLTTHPLTHSPLTLPIPLCVSVPLRLCVKFKRLRRSFHR